MTFYIRARCFCQEALFHPFRRFRNRIGRAQKKPIPAAFRILKALGPT